MIVKIKFILLTISLALFSSCASIVSKSNYPITISSKPSEAKISVTNRDGNEVYEGKTPAIISLESKSSFFKKAIYKVKFEKEGYDTKTATIEFKVDGWYYGNIVFGGLIGMLIIDPATGAMYKPRNPNLVETLSENSAKINKKELKIYSINEISDDWKKQLVKLNN